MKNRIKSLRIEKGLSQTELSEQIGCTQQSLSKIENGIQVPGVDLAFKIADFFNVTVEFLYYETNFSGNIKTDQEFNEFTEHLQRLMKYLDNQTMMGSMTFGINFWGVEFRIT